ncbi:Protein of unknown function [Pyronema omphalodes CBS 100304]|uniref:Uncharacterized protein n=1 Tax=Pyronema omphalodes (strain CBS 100304) TaxID=1076935 RepID=U4LSW0_PYROM|nr:Protein of unknown function [Pyronema omphalodes CBS 100304]
MSKTRQIDGPSVPKPLKPNSHHPAHRIFKHQGSKQRKRPTSFTTPENKKAANKKRLPDHPLVNDFNNSLNRSTSSITAKLASTLQDSHQIRISRFAAATAQSQSYIDNARELTGNLGATPILSEESDKQVQEFNNFVDQKKIRIRALWDEWESITKEIIGIRSQVIAINPLRNTDQKGDHGDDEDGDEDDGEIS